MTGWTAPELDRLRALDRDGADAAAIAAALGREPGDVAERIALVRATGPALAGPDEEGEVGLPETLSTAAPAWIHAAPDA